MTRRPSGSGSSASDGIAGSRDRRRVRRQVEDPYDPIIQERLAPGRDTLTPGPDTAVDAIERLGTGWALEVVASLPPDQAEAVMLRVVAGLDVAQTAQVLGKRPGAVRVAAMRGLRKLANHPQVLARMAAAPARELDGHSSLDSAQPEGV